MISAEGRAHGAYTVNLMRSRMSDQERRSHDQAWGLDFGDPNEVRLEVVREPKKKPGLLAALFGGKAKAVSASEAFHDHPMCINMLPKIEAQLKADSSPATEVDNSGWTMLQHESLAGNFGVVKLLVHYGADPRKTTPAGQTAAELARAIGWLEIGAYLDRTQGANPA